MFRNPYNSRYQTARLFFEIPFAVSVSWILNTTLCIYLLHESPFEGSPKDVPIS
jgi:hypothetical protein